MASHSLDVLSQLSLEVPGAMAERATGRRATDPAAPAALAASVVLIREVDGQLETYLLHRHARMSFAASMVVFPGGRVDPVDGETDPIGRCALRETAEETGVVLVRGDLRPWAHWVTPEIEPRRYDTHFFVAPLPAGQTADDLSGETDRAEWSTPQRALAEADAGTIGLMPPTRSVLLELAGLGSVAAVLAAASDRVVERVLPAVVATADGWRFGYPGRMT